MINCQTAKDLHIEGCGGQCLSLDEVNALYHKYYIRMDGIAGHPYLRPALLEKGFTTPIQAMQKGYYIIHDTELDNFLVQY